MKKLLSSLLIMSCVSVTASAEPKKLWSLEGFSEPESALMDPDKGYLYVTNIEGSPMGIDGKGSVSLVSKDGKMIKREWSTGLDAPKGMAIRDQELLVADMKSLRVISRSSGQLLQSYRVEEAKMLNDVAVDSAGVAYVTDFIGGTVYRLEESGLKPWLTAAEIPHPNGLFVKGGKLLIAAWGKGMKDDFTTDSAGSLYQVDLASKAISPYPGGADMGNLDGIGFSGERLIVNDWINGNVFSVTDGVQNKIFGAGKTAADISVHEDVLYVPVMFQHRLDAYTLK